jgi:hypothetical protein
VRRLASTFASSINAKLVSGNSGNSTCTTRNQRLVSQFVEAKVHLPERAGTETARFEIAQPSSCRRAYIDAARREFNRPRGEFSGFVL